MPRKLRVSHEIRVNFDVSSKFEISGESNVIPRFLLIYYPDEFELAIAVMS